MIKVGDRVELTDHPDHPQGKVLEVNERTEACLVEWDKSPPWNTYYGIWRLLRVPSEP